MSNRFKVDANLFDAASLENAYNSQEPQPHQPKHSSVKQANEITLKQLKSPQKDKEETASAEFDEKEHLLGGQQQQLQSARVNFKALGSGGGDVAAAARNASLNVADEVQQQQQQQQQQFKSGEMTQYSNTDSPAPHSKLDKQKFPEELQFTSSSVAQNGTTIILTPTSLNSATTTTTTAKPMSPGGGSNSGGGGDDGNGNASGNNAVSGRAEQDEYKGPKLWRHLVLHWPVLSEPLAILVVFLALWTIGYILLPQYAAPQVGIMRIVFLFVGAQLAGILVTFLHLPDMLGMLFFGVLYTNVGLADFTGYQPLEAFLREMALINIMLLAGLGLDGNAFKKLWLMILRLTLVPTIAEVAIIAVLARYSLSMPWTWGILLGLVITAVSPNVVVTVMLKLKEERLGLNGGIHTLIYAMTTCNDVVAIFLFGVILGVIFSTGTLTQQILQGPVGIGIGLVFGYIYGLMLQFLPSKRSGYVNGLRFVLTVLGGTISVMGSKTIGFPSAGALGCVTVAFVGGLGWKREQRKLTPQQLDTDENSSVPKRLDLLWKFLKPVSFALIGKEINFAVLDGRVVGYGALLVLLGSLFRLAFAYISTYGGNLSWKERAYITISGFPKATVQAALGPVALDLARSLNADQENLSLASNVLVISVLAIIFTAPLGAILMLRLAPLWLQRSTPAIHETGCGDDGGADMMNSSRYARNLSYRSNKSQNAVDGDSSVPTDVVVSGERTKTAHHLA